MAAFRIGNGLQGRTRAGAVSFPGSGRHEAGQIAANRCPAGIGGSPEVDRGRERGQARRMRTPRGPAGIVAALIVSAALVPAPAAWPSSKRSKRTFDTGSFVVTCTSTGQLCSPPEILQLALPRHGTVTSVRYTTAPAHCSALVLQVMRRGRVRATSSRLLAGKSTTTLATSIPVPSGASALSFRAKGFVGGCNVGRLGSWGGRVVVTVQLAR